MYGQWIIQHLLDEEGYRPIVYRDTLDFPTVGIGHLILDFESLEVGDTVQDVYIRNEFNKDLANAEAGFLRLFRHDELHGNQARKVALVSMVFQMGDGELGGVGGFHMMIAAIRAGDWAEASKEALDSVWASDAQTPARAKRVARMLKTGRYPV